MARKKIEPLRLPVDGSNPFSWPFFNPLLCSGRFTVYLPTGGLCASVSSQSQNNQQCSSFFPTGQPVLLQPSTTSFPGLLRLEMTWLAQRHHCALHSQTLHYYSGF